MALGLQWLVESLQADPLTRNSGRRCLCGWHRDCASVPGRVPAAMTSSLSEWWSAFAIRAPGGTASGYAFRRARRRAGTESCGRRSRRRAATGCPDARRRTGSCPPAAAATPASGSRSARRSSPAPPGSRCRCPGRRGRTSPPAAGTTGGRGSAALLARRCDGAAPRAPSTRLCCCCAAAWTRAREGRRSRGAQMAGEFAAAESWTCAAAGRDGRFASTVRGHSTQSISIWWPAKRPECHPRPA